MTKEKRSTKTPRRVSTRKRTSSTKGIYYDEHFDECTDVPGTDTIPTTSTLLSPPALVQVHVSNTVEESDSSTESLPVPEQVPGTVCVEQGDECSSVQSSSSDAETAPSITLLSPPAPVRVPVSNTVEESVQNLNRFLALLLLNRVMEVLL